MMKEPELLKTWHDGNGAVWVEYKIGPRSTAKMPESYASEWLESLLTNNYPFISLDKKLVVAVGNYGHVELSDVMEFDVGDGKEEWEEFTVTQIEPDPHIPGRYTVKAER
jgi:hypothetical protein